MKREFNYTVSKEDHAQGLSIRELMRRNFSFSSRLRTKIKKEHSVFINGAEAQVWKKPQPGDVITVRLPQERSYFEPQDIPVNVLFEDDDIMLINKQPGVCVHPTNGNPDHTIANGLTRYMEQSGQIFKIRFINRLDMDTSGILAVGKNSHAQDDFVKQQKRGHVKKEYLAVVNGIIEEEDGVIDAPLGRPENEPLRRGVVEGGKPSVTHYRVLERYFDAQAPGGGWSLVALRLETGRTHQIRVHMSFIGHPVTGDWLYDAPSPLIGRQALHAASLTFPHPVTGETMCIRAPLPDDIEELIKAISNK